MSIVSQAFGFVLVSLIVINGLLGGGVVDAIGTFATDDEKEQARLDLMCGAGYLMWTPTTDIYGFDIPSPSYTNVILAALITLSMVLVIRIATAIDWSFKYSIILFIVVWFAIKIIGYLLMYSAGDYCTAWAVEMVEQTGGFYDVAALGGAAWGLKILWGIRK